MSGKTLSSGTLSLKFMQNAHRAKQLAHVEAEQAQVKDEAEWEVSKEVREGWGLDSSSNNAGPSVIYEASYMPFLFDREISEDSNKPKGRRTFNKKGVEVVEEEPKVEEIPSSSQPKDPESIQDRSPKYKRPATISGSSKEPKSKKAASTRTAQEMIRDSSGVGTDLRSTSNARPAQATSLGNIFLKPSGVDEPLDGVKSSGARGDDAKRPTPNGNAKRERDATSDFADKDTKKRKKKKSPVE